MQHERAKFQNKLNQVQLCSLVNIIMVKIKIEPGIRYFNLSEKLNMMIQWSVVGDSVTCVFSKVYKRNQQVQTNILLLTSE